MYKNTTALSVAISLALGTAAVAPLAAQAEEQQVEKLQKMKVTGSRLTRASMEGSTPVAVIGRAEIERAGDISIADVLRNLHSTLSVHTAKVQVALGRAKQPCHYVV